VGGGHTRKVLEKIRGAAKVGKLPVLPFKRCCCTTLIRGATATELTASATLFRFTLDESDL